MKIVFLVAGVRALIGAVAGFATGLAGLWDVWLVVGAAVLVFYRLSGRGTELSLED